MHLTFIIRTDEDYRRSVELEVDGKEVASFYDGEPEDNSLSRNFNDVLSIPDLMRLAHEAGVRGEPFTCEVKDIIEE